jgi:hypothetical protein
MKKTAKEVFYAPYTFKEINFMTPNVVGYYHITDGAVELAWGFSILGDRKIYGVTVTRSESIDMDASKCFFSRAAAEKYIEELGGDDIVG